MISISKIEHESIISVLGQRRRDYERMVTKSMFIYKLIRYFSNSVDLWKYRIKKLILLTAFNLFKTDYIVRTIKEFNGEFELSINSELTWVLMNGDFEEHIVQLFKNSINAGDHVIDVGANIGMYSVLASKLVGDTGKVLSIEPVPHAFILLESNIKRNGLKNIIHFNGAVTSQGGACSFNVVDNSTEYSSIGDIVHPHASKQVKKIDVICETLDDLVFKHSLRPSCIKIDVEGAEGLVLSGADAVLRYHRPIILSELDDRLLKQLKWDSHKVISILMDYRYKVFDVNKGIEISGNLLESPFIGEIIALPIA